MKLSRIFFAGAVLLPGIAVASSGATDGARMDLTGHWVGWFGIAVFLVAYALVMAEEFTHLRKSKPVIIAAGDHLGRHRLGLRTSRDTPCRRAGSAP